MLLYILAVEEGKYMYVSKTLNGKSTVEGRSARDTNGRYHLKADLVADFSSDQV
jgi:hypothetical protein